MVVTNTQEGVDVLVVVDARNDESLIPLLQSRGVCAGIACKPPTPISHHLFENLNGVAAATGRSKHHVHWESATVGKRAPGPLRIARMASVWSPTRNWSS